jgi:hypothetical protein
VCGALWGARYGYSALPRDWLAAMPNKAWLDRKVVRFLNLMGLTDVEQKVVEKSYEERARDEPPPRYASPYLHHAGGDDAPYPPDDDKEPHWT